MCANEPEGRGLPTTDETLRGAYRAPRRLLRESLSIGQFAFYYTDGTIYVDPTRVAFEPRLTANAWLSGRSVPGKAFELSAEDITAIRAGDNFLWRGLVIITTRKADKQTATRRFLLGPHRAALLAASASAGHPCPE